MKYKLSPIEHTDFTGATGMCQASQNQKADELDSSEEYIDFINALKAVVDSLTRI